MAILSSASRVDVFVIGGGPAGLAIAISLRSRGFRVSLADSSRPPINKCCGEGIMPDGVQALHDLGVVMSDGEAVPFQGIRFIEDSVSVRGRFPKGPGLGIRRTVLHDALRSRAESLGVELLWGTPVRGIEEGIVFLDRAQYEARWIIGADGQNSRVRQWAGLDHPGAISRRFGVRRHFQVVPWTDLVEVHWSQGCEAYVTPTGRSEVCVAFLTDEKNLHFETALERFPRLGRNLDGISSSSDQLGAISSLRKLDRVVHGNLALIGDASGSVDAITGDGVSLAFHQARSLTDAIQREDLSRYQKAHRRLRTLPTTMTRLMLALDSRSRLRRRVFRSLAVNEDTFSRILGVHVRAFPASSLGLARVAHLIWQCLGSATPLEELK